MSPRGSASGGKDSKKTQEVQQPSSIQPDTSIVRELRLEPADWFWVSWNPPRPLSRPAPPAFDLADALKRLSSLKTSNRGRQWDWEAAQLAESLTPAEAHFWFLAMTAVRDEELKPKQLAATLAKASLTGQITPQQAFDSLKNASYLTTPRVVQALAHLLPARALTEVLIQPLFPDGFEQSTRQVFLVEGFRRYVRPFLTRAEVTELQELLGSQIDPTLQRTSLYDAYPPAYYFAGFLGLGERLRPIIASWADDRFHRKPRQDDRYQKPQWMILCLGTPEAIESEFIRLQLQFKDEHQIRAWLALTGFKALERIQESLQKGVMTEDWVQKLDKERSADLVRAFVAAVNAPEAAPVILALQQGPFAPNAAREWLDQHVGNAIAGLLTVAATGRGKLQAAAQEFLQAKKSQGFEELLRTGVSGATAAVATSIQRQVLARTEVQQETLTEAITPGWLKEALEQTRQGLTPQIPTWADASTMPPILVNGKRLATEHLGLVHAALQASEPERHPLITALRQQADRNALADFAWALFQRWMQEDAPPQEKWALRTLGYFGSDATALKLTPLIRAWPGERQHTRAMLGLECLREIGSDTALMQINGIAQNAPFKAIQKEAARTLEELARLRGLTRDQLEDRIVPDLGLDQRGQRSFDFGPRQFQFQLGSDFQPMLRDPEGKLRKDLPKPAAKDDESKASAAVADWKLLKKQVQEAIKTQVQRLEQALISGRVWSREEFEALLVRHPLVGLLAQRLLWGAYDEQDRLVQTFRVTEERDYAGADDQSWPLEARTVGLVHPIQLDTDQKSAWDRIFAEYRIVQPFDQLTRPVHRLPAKDAKKTELQKLEGLQLPATTLLGSLERRGWSRGPVEDNGVYSSLVRPFPRTQLTAVLEFQPGLNIGQLADSKDQKVSRCFFVRGTSGSARDAVPLGKAGEIPLSEVLGDLEFLASKVE